MSSNQERDRHCLISKKVCKQQRRLIAPTALIILSSLIWYQSAAAFTCPQPPPGAGSPQQASCGNAEFQSCGIDVNGINRHFCIHVPSAGPPQVTRDLPVILAFHGRGGDATRQVPMWDKHTEQGIVLVAPSALVSGNGTDCAPAWRGIRQAIPNWADLANADGCGLAGAVIPPRFSNLPYQTGGDNGDDLQFVREMVTVINQDPEINPTGLYAAGFSSGAGMVYQLFITLPHAEYFDGFAAISNVMTDARITAQAAAVGGAGYQPNQSVRRPFFFAIGSNDKVNSPKENIVLFVDGNAVPNGSCPPVSTAADVVRCWSSAPTYPGSGKHDMYPPRFITTRWLVTHNNSVKRAIESLYPDLGHGSGPESESDATLAVRQDFMRKPGNDDSEAVAVVTIIDGGHSWSGKSGNHPPCRNRNCDIDTTEEILQFWRANAGLRSNWR